ncbi:hypothetical protein LTR36_003147 [Oleoguttula mirabilis]|uniref:2EXR domain-containing protein n=1 Tax=Oleoguttula mirabilis TaxID=1507867 RepID=A0AAV9JYM0_9PEZI|nr:hypothetical protein LTR36_003147 [Oleoguttula mirabilis]
MENSPLARLPPELRNRIYELALKSDRPFTLVFKHMLGQEPSAQQRHPTGLARTCKALRKEATQLFYAINAFEIQTDESPDYISTTCCYLVRNVRAFVDMIGASNACALRSITLGPPCVIHYCDWYAEHRWLLQRVLEEMQGGRLLDLHACDVRVRMEIECAMDGSSDFTVEVDMRALGRSWDRIEGLLQQGLQATHHKLDGSGQRLAMKSMLEQLEEFRVVVGNA